MFEPIAYDNGLVLDVSRRYINIKPALLEELGLPYAYVSGDRIYAFKGKGGEVFYLVPAVPSVEARTLWCSFGEVAFVIISTAEASHVFPLFHGWMLGLSECESDVTRNLGDSLMEAYDAGRHFGRTRMGLDQNRFGFFFEAGPFDNGPRRVRFTPWTNGAAVGFEVLDTQTKNKEYVYLNPSTEGWSADVFVYRGETGRPDEDESVVFVNVLKTSRVVKMSREGAFTVLPEEEVKRVDLDPLALGFRKFRDVWICEAAEVPLMKKRLEEAGFEAEIT